MTRSAVKDADRQAVAQFIEKHWKSRIVMSQGKVFHPHKEEGVLERRDGEIVGLLTYHMNDDGMEILTLNSVLEGQGIGSSLMLDAIEEARRRNCSCISLTTTNDNLRVIGFYQRLGFRMIAINLGVVDEARKIKPQIPEVGSRGVPIHDEIVLELKIKPHL